MIHAVYRHTEAPMPRRRMAQRISGAGFRTYVAEIQGSVVGYLVAAVRDAAFTDRLTETEGTICDLFVLAEHRRRGIASDLYAAASRWFDERGCVCEGLTVYPGNPALQMYEDLGFSQYSINMRKRRDPARPSGTPQR